MKTVKKYVTNDGRQFETAREARKHEADAVVMAKVATLLQSSLSTLRREAVLMEIVDSAAELVKVLKTVKRPPLKTVG